MKVAIGYLHRADAISPQFSFSLLMLCVKDAKRQQRIAGVLNQESSANISAGRCNVVRNFLELGADWLWMVDSDMKFDVDILDRLLRVANPDTKPIVGGLCFGLALVDGRYEAFPTLYSVGEDGSFWHWKDYPRDQVVQVDSTGAACVLIHRRVLADPRWQTPVHPFPWFRESVASGKPMSEDHFFFLKAKHLGYPLHVDTGASMGHMKPVVVDQDYFEGHQPTKFEIGTVNVKPNNSEQLVAELQEYARRNGGLRIPPGK